MLNDKRKYNRPPKRHAHQKGPGIVARQKLTVEGAQRRKEWLWDYESKLRSMVRAERE